MVDDLATVLAGVEAAAVQFFADKMVHLVHVNRHFVDGHPLESHVRAKLKAACQGLLHVLGGDPRRGIVRLEPSPNRRGVNAVHQVVQQYRKPRADRLLPCFVGIARISSSQVGHGGRFLVAFLLAKLAVAAEANSIPVRPRCGVK